MQTHGKKLFIGLMKLDKKAPWKHRAPTTEIEYPWRTCPRSLIIKLPFGYGVVTGKWQKADEPWHQSLEEILGARKLDFETTIEASAIGSSENIPEDRENLGYASIS